MLFAVWASDCADVLAERLRVREAHRARLRARNDVSVRVVLAGPTLDDASGAMNGTLLIVEAGSIGAVRAFVDSDPYSMAGVYDRVEIRPWRCGLGTPTPPSLEMG